MRQSLLILIGLLTLNLAFAEPPPPRITKSVRSLQVMRLSLQTGVLRLVTRHPDVTEGIYEEVLLRGPCAVLIDNPEKGWDKSRIRRIEVMNKTEQQGYALIQARQSCLSLSELEDEQEKKARLQGNTVPCSNGFCLEAQQGEPQADKSKAENGNDNEN